MALFNCPIWGRHPRPHQRTKQPFSRDWAELPQQLSKRLLRLLNEPMSRRPHPPSLEGMRFNKGQHYPGYRRRNDWFSLVSEASVSSNRYERPTSFARRVSGFMSLIGNPSAPPWCANPRYLTRFRDGGKITFRHRLHGYTEAPVSRRAPSVQQLAAEEFQPLWEFSAAG